DVYGARKPSFEVLRVESSPIESLSASGAPDAMTVTVRTRAAVPAYELRDYRLRGVLYGPGDVPLERVEAALPALRPGAVAKVSTRFREAKTQRIEFDVLRPTGFSALTHVWRP
ncbi:MAG TPA: hypothetical protein VMG58_18530, partial [Candidatus Sulfotelmatobacter sp.]|nr:hypothetical protein [Candidatus Sulfotelmatobacter sp.]